MSIFDQLMQQAQGLDINAVARQVGISPEQVQQAGRALLPQIADPNVDNQQATANVAAQTGIDMSQLSALVPALLAQAQGAGAPIDGGPFGAVVAGLAGGAPAAAAPAAAPAAPAAGADSLLGQIGQAVDRDGDGNPVNDIMNMLGRR